MNFVEELKWRGMIHDIMPGTEEQLQKEMTTAIGLILPQTLYTWLIGSNYDIGSSSALWS